MSYLPSEAKDERLLTMRAWLPGTLAFGMATLSTTMLWAIASEPESKAKAAVDPTPNLPNLLEPTVPNLEGLCLLPELCKPPVAPPETLISRLPLPIQTPAKPFSVVLPPPPSVTPAAKGYAQLLATLAKMPERPVRTVKTSAPNKAEDRNWQFRDQDLIADDPALQELALATEAMVGDHSATLTVVQRPVPLTLQNVVALALATNPQVKQAYWENLTQVAEKGGSVTTPSKIAVYVGRNSSGNLAIDQLVVRLEMADAQPVNLNLQDSSVQIKQALGNPLEVKGATAETWGDRHHLLRLKSSLSDRLTQAVFAYHRLVDAQESLNLAQTALTYSQQLLTPTQALIAAGKQPIEEQVHHQADIARKKTQFVVAQREFDTARLVLLDLLGLDQAIQLTPVPLAVVDVTPVNLEQITRMAFQNNPSYGQALVTKQAVQTELLQLKDAQRRNLGTNQETDQGLVLSQSFGGNTLEQRYQHVQKAFVKASQELERQQQGLEKQLGDRIRELNASQTQLAEAEKARIFAQKQLNAAQAQFAAGNSMTSELLDAQNALIQARNWEVKAMTNYLNARAYLDRVMGTTLDTWEVKVQPGG